jgi:hypothetical protein
MKPIQLFGTGIHSRSPNVTAQQRVNMFLEFSAQGDKTQVTAYRTPGLRLITSLGDNPIRGWYAQDAFLYAVAGDKLYKIDSSYTATVIGTLSTLEGRVGMASNGLELIIVDGANGYTYNYGTTTFAAIADGDFPGGNTVTFNDSFFIVNKPSSGQLWISASYDGTAWDGAAFATAESNPDNLIAVWADHGELILFADLTTEIWINTGALDFPYSRVGTAIEWGLAARWSVAKFDNSLVWLAKNRLGEVQITRLNGYTPQRISTHDLESIINGYSNLANASAFSYLYNGHPFYQINFDEGSWLYDGASDVWSQVKGYGIDRHRGEQAVVFGNTILVADYQNGNIYTPDGDTYDDNGQPLIAELVSRHVSSNGDRISFSKLWLDMETGVGTSTGQGACPQISLETYKDGGHIPSNKRFTQIGKIGEYKTRPIFTRLGMARDWVFKVSVSDPVKVVIMGAYVG